MTQIAPPSSLPPMPSTFTLATRTVLGMGNLPQTLHVETTDTGTKLTLRGHYWWHSRERGLDASQVAKLPDVQAGVEQLRRSYDALQRTDLPAPTSDGIVSPIGESRIRIEGKIYPFLKHDDNANRAAVRDAIYGLAALIRKHTPKPY